MSRAPFQCTWEAFQGPRHGILKCPSNTFLLGNFNYQSGRDNRNAKYFIQFHIAGPTLPFNFLIDSAMAESPDGDGVLIFGGQNGDIPDKIIELRARANSWVTLNQKLKNPHYQHTVIPISNYHED